MIAFLSDKKNQVAVAAALATLLLQVARSKGWDFLDADTANHLTLAVVALGVGLMGSHAHVENGEAHADGAIDAAKVAKPTA